MAFVPQQSTWDLWSDAQQPNFLSFPITGTSDYGIATYRGCDGVDLIDVNLNLVLEQVHRNDLIDGSDVYNWFGQSLKVVSDVALSDDLLVRLVLYRREDQTGNINGTDFVFHGYTSVTIPSGTTESNTLTIDYPNSWQNAYYDPQNLNWWTDSGVQAWEKQGTFGIATQQTVPSCAPPPPTCDLEITGTTSTNPTFQGGSDGTITVSIDGGTAPITYSLNGGTPQSSGTFTGLAAGTYNVYVEDDSDPVCFDQTEQITLQEGEFRTGDFTVVEPNDFVASENPIITSLSTQFNDAPVFAVSTFTFDNGIEDNFKVTFNLTAPTAYAATFTAKDFPNRETFFTTTVLDDADGNAIGVNTLEEVADSFGEAVLKDINLNRWYFVSVTDNVVTLTAKEARASMTLTSSNVDILDETGSPATTGITLTEVATGVDANQGSQVDDYSLYTDIYVGNELVQYGDVLSAQTYQNYTSLELPFDIITNDHQFDASEIMKTFVSTPKIDLTFTGFTVISGMIRPFYVRYGEKYPLVANTNTKKKRSKGDTGYKWVLNSSLEWENANDVSDYFTGGKFLTNSPNPLDIQREQTNFLYFILPKNYGQTLELRGDIDYYDGSSQSGITFIDIASGSTNSGGVYALNVSYDSLGLESYEASGNTKIKNCTFAVYEGEKDELYGYDGIYTEFKRYRFEIDEQPRKFGVSFENALGGYDTFDFVGIVENTISRENKTYTTPRDIQSDGSSPEGFKNTAMFNTKVTKSLVVNSGWIDEEHFDWLIELCSSNNIYSYSEPNQNYLNVANVTYTKSSLEDLFEVEITFNATIFENNITV